MTVREAADRWRNDRAAADARFHVVLRQEVARGVTKQRVAEEAGLSRTTLDKILKESQ